MVEKGRDSGGSEGTEFQDTTVEDMGLLFSSDDFGGLERGGW